MLTNPPMIIAIINSSAASGLRCSLARRAAMSSPKSTGSSTSIKMNARSENKGRLVIRDHSLVPEQRIDPTSPWLSERVRSARRWNAALVFRLRYPGLVLLKSQRSLKKENSPWTLDKPALLHNGAPAGSGLRSSRIL
jgi:hypothetical protein